MFGYIITHRQELKVREDEAYQAAYCGLCRSLKKRHGRPGQMTLSYDMTFLALLLTGLYEPKTKTGSRRCPAHPLRRSFYRENRYYDYAADVNVVLTYYKCLDDWEDERRLSRLLCAGFLKGRMKKLKVLYGRKIAETGRRLRLLQEVEQEGICDVDRTSGLFGEIMAEWFVYREDEWEKTLRHMGFFFGKFIYLMDAFEDVEEDLAHGRYNPFAEMCEKESFEQDCGMILKMMMAETCRAFERLPILKDAELLRNILYAGVWTQYAQIRRKRKEMEEKS